MNVSLTASTSILPRECADLHITTSGVYTIYPYGKAVPEVSVYCYVDSSLHAWTVNKIHRDLIFEWLIQSSKYVKRIKGKFWYKVNNKTKNKNLLFSVNERDIYQIYFSSEYASQISFCNGIWYIASTQKNLR